MRLQLLPIVLVAAISVLYMYVSNQDYKDQKDQETRYCQMVHDKAWPDYQGIYNKVCKAKFGRIGSVK